MEQFLVKLVQGLEEEAPFLTHTMVWDGPVGVQAEISAM